MLTDLFKRSKLLSISSLCLVLAACGGDQDTTETNTFDRDRFVPTDNELGADSQTPPRAEATSLLVRIDDVIVGATEDDPGISIGSVYVAGDASLGFESRTLYTFDNDMGSSTCFDDCELMWPPYTVQSELSQDLIDAVNAANGGVAGTIARPNGTLQVTFNGMPLYFFAGDSVPFTAAEGDELQMLDVNGLDIGGVWFPLGFERFNPTASTENGELGEIFVAAAPLAGEMAGFTLYTPPDDFLMIEQFVPDNITLPTGPDDFCDQACLDLIQSQLDMLELQEEYAAAIAMYTPLTVELAAFVQDSGIINTIERDGAIQVTLNNLPLFFFNGDMAAGEANGHGPDLDVPFIAAGFSPEVEAEVGLRLVATINGADTDLVTLIDNGISECCGAPAQDPDLMQAIFLTGPGDGISFQVPAEADGMNVLGVDHFRGPGGFGIYNVEVDGMMEGTITPFTNSTDFVSLQSATSDPDALIYFETPLTAGQVIQVTTGGTEDFLGANIGDIKMYVAEPAAFQIINAWDPASGTLIIDNGVSECCGSPVQDEDLELVLFLTGDGDGVEFVLPTSAAGATFIGANVFRGVDGAEIGSTPGDMTVFRVDGMAETEIGRLAPTVNSTDFVTLVPGADPTFFTAAIDPPLAGGETIRIVVSGGNFSAGNISTVGAYGPSPVMDRVATFETWTDQVTVLTNSISECCGEPTQDADLEQLLFITGDGDGAQIVVPPEAEGATRIGVDVFRGPSGVGEVRVVLDAVEVGTIDIAQITEDFVTPFEGSRTMFFFDFATPLTAGQTVNIEATGEFSAGNFGVIALFDILDD